MNYDSRSWKVHHGSDHRFDRPAPHSDNVWSGPYAALYTEREVFVA